MLGDSECVDCLAAEHLFQRLARAHTDAHTHMSVHLASHPNGVDDNDVDDDYKLPHWLTDDIEIDRLLGHTHIHAQQGAKPNNNKNNRHHTPTTHTQCKMHAKRVRVCVRARATPPINRLATVRRTRTLAAPAHPPMHACMHAHTHTCWGTHTHTRTLTTGVPCRVVLCDH